MTRPRRICGPDADRGSVMLLALGFIVICILAVAVVVDASVMFLRQRSLQSVADGAALAGAQAIDLEAYYRRGADYRIQLDPQQVQRAVQHYVRNASPSGVSLESVELVGRTVIVRMRTEVRPPFSGWLTPGGAHDVRVESGAELSYRG